VANNKLSLHKHLMIMSNNHRIETNALAINNSGSGSSLGSLSEDSEEGSSSAVFNASQHSAYSRELFDLFGENKSRETFCSSNSSTRDEDSRLPIINHLQIQLAATETELELALENARRLERSLTWTRQNFYSTFENERFYYEQMFSTPLPAPSHYLDPTIHEESVEFLKLQQESLEDKMNEMENLSRFADIEVYFWFWVGVGVIV
jgi:hypothetical protein